MNFFEQQDQARRRTGRLIVLFIVAVFLILAAVNAATYGILHMLAPHMAYLEDAAPVLREDRTYPGSMRRIEPLWRDPLIYGGVTLAVLLIIGGGSLYKTAMLSRGGHAVASMLGGTPLDTSSAQGQDRVLMNVVEEMSIASGVPVPSVYVLENEQAINAFAAGFTTEDAVIGVTRGCLQNLNRDELQGVIAHEFSHILNGDMRLNIRLIGILHGILVIGLMGYALIRTLQFARIGGRRSNDKGGGNAIIVIALAGVALLVIGYLGVFFGRLIQAAVSRQREFLADASAVQFTRNPRGIAGALMKIAGYSSGSRVQNYHAVETAHMFFAQGIAAGITGLLATHPPIEERIRRIDPTFDGSTLNLEQPVSTQVAPHPAAAGFASGRVALDPQSVVERAGSVSAEGVVYADQLLRSIPASVIEAAHDPFSARAVVYCLLISDQPEVREKQLELLGASVEPGLCREVRRLLDETFTLSRETRLPLLDLSLPALRQMAPAQIAQFRQIIRALIQADSRVTLYEYAMLKVVGQHLKLPDDPARRIHPKYFSISAVRDEIGVVLTALAAASQTDTQRAFESGASRLNSELPIQPAQQADLATVNAALNRLDLASPPVKQRIIDACAHTVAADGQVSVTEAEMLRAIASSLDVPLPPLLGADSSDKMNQLAHDAGYLRASP